MREVLGVALRDDGDANPAVERGQELRQRSAAGLPAAADPFGIDFGAREQVVDPANAVPDAKQTEVGAEQDQAASGIFMLARPAAEGRLASAGSRILDAFALPERVVRQDRVSLAREIRKQFLIARPRLAVCRMSERSQDRRMASLRRRQIEIRGDVELRPAFEHDLLDAITAPLDDAGDARVERSRLERSAEHLPDLFGHGSLTFLDGLRR